MSIATERKRRILTTHVGSLPRPEALSEFMAAQMDGRTVDAGKYAAAVSHAVADCVASQLETGIDIISDGEQSKPSFYAYVHQRLGGIQRRTGSPQGRSHTKEIDAFPDFYTAGHSGTQPAGFECVGPMTYAGTDLLKIDLDNLRAAVAGRNPVDVFIPAASVATVEGAVVDRHYNNEEAYLAAIIEAMRVEYEAIVAAGFSVQLDDPRLAMHYMLNPQMTVKEAQAWARRRVEAMNESVRNIPSDRIRHHTCYGINIGPRTHDLEMKHLTDIILSINADHYSFEYGNPRHEHEAGIWKGVKLPEGKALLPGFVTHASVLVEHPELVAQRIVRFADIVGKEHVIASTDCGFASSPRAVPEVIPSIVTAKLQSLVEGAKLASKHLFG
ncbi:MULTISPECIES: cobalamin-independent methionine synthase II family protein [unclassified Beijerinckia]|uniref:cobalamin-independent methionine synthase II family protein n=1 Tax=unclassified Beijerinckia TaxID=2638183 RepID=UPI00089A9404|nr:MULTISPECIES: cobalamin-independent methionine synthase II family protein [unclassified Beijerinckia]MDH7798213.1 5-methyltetrahydropteroyltriglutamate--homocysteine methyltransferase [Beijerinckia sp. GAS462]SED13068.1 5-methyltetrahydropteroyltriglutamate--homocysteine methyltransferase [Beijerinckia sp. 28-YEA-48]